MASDPQDRSAAGALGSRPQPPPEPPRRSGRGRIAALLAGVLLLAGVAVLTLVLLDEKDENASREAAATRRAVAAETVRLRRIQAPHRGAAAELRPAAGATRAERLAARTAPLDAARASILADARRRAAAGELAGPVVAVTCGTPSRDPNERPDHLVLTREDRPLRLPGRQAP